MELTYFPIFERMLKSGGLRNGTEMARAIGVTPQAISNYRKKQLMPPGIIIKFSNIYKVSIDWLITGKGYAYISDVNTEEKDAAAAERHVSAHRLPNSLGVMILTPDEMICVGKLLTALRRNDGNMSTEIKTGIDALLNAPRTY